MNTGMHPSDLGRLLEALDNIRVEMRMSNSLHALSLVYEYGNTLPQEQAAALAETAIYCVRPSKP